MIQNTRSKQGLGLSWSQILNFLAWNRLIFRDGNQWPSSRVKKLFWLNRRSWFKLKFAKKKKMLTAKKSLEQMEVKPKKFHADPEFCTSHTYQSMNFSSRPQKIAKFDHYCSKKALFSNKM